MFSKKGWYQPDCMIIMVSKEADIIIKKVDNIDQIAKIADLMQEIWDLSDREVVPIFELKAVSAIGLLLGAFLSDDLQNPIGFIYAFPKFPDAHWSHMMGIDHDYQSKNIGYLLKAEHRKIALAQDNPKIRTIEWTVDPLLGANASLNFRKLGVICNTYFENYYGTSEGVGIYSSTPTDRLKVEWILEAPRVNQRFASPDDNDDENSNLIIQWKDPDELLATFPPLNESVFDNNILLCPTKSIDISRSDNLPATICVEIPANFATNNDKESLDWQNKWRLYFRSVCNSLFSQEYYLVDFFSFKNKTGKSRRNFYIVTNELKNYNY